jgi:MtN3 and saliva related transmembrane protein
MVQNFPQGENGRGSSQERWETAAKKARNIGGDWQKGREKKGAGAYIWDMMPLTEIWMMLIGAVMALSGVPQIVRMIARRSSGDISLAMFGVLLFGQAWWIWYGLRIGSPSVVLMNTAAFLVNLVIISLAVWYRK